MTRPGLLVSVRTADEARAAVLGGATVIDVKEPARGPLGMADRAVWREVRLAVPHATPVSVALGELRDWIGRPPPARDDFAGVSFRKLGLAGAGPRWAEDWSRVREAFGGGPPWIAVIYADWTTAGSPEPDAVIDEAASIPECAGVLIDTWSKASGRVLDLSWADRVRRIGVTGGLVALAGGLDVEGIRSLHPLDPDLFAVRGAACVGGDRLGTIDAAQVRRLAFAMQRPCFERADFRSPLPAGGEG